jgi:hypothetical protein
VQLAVVKLLRWRLVGRYPEGDSDGLDSRLLPGAEALLLEAPPGLTAEDVRSGGRAGN